MNGIAMTSNQWNKLTFLKVSGVPLIYLLCLGASNWSNNCRINHYDFNNIGDDGFALLM